MGKGSGGSASTATEVDDNLVSSQVISIIDLISEGPIKGVVDDLKGVYLNDTAVISSSGTENYSGVDFKYNLGTEDQSYLSGFAGSSNEITVGVEVKYGTPVVRTITDSTTDRLNLVVGVSQLYSTDNGSIKYASVKLSAQVYKNGAWVEFGTMDLINKKVRSEYVQSIPFYDLPPVPFDIRVVRVTPDSSSTSIVNGTFWRSYSEIVDDKFKWPLAAYVGIKVDSKNFSGVPSRNYLVDGIICQVPSNYNPITRAYTGFWNGELKGEWTDNPAWILYDLLTSKRYGLGRRINESMIDKLALYSIGQFCDQLVDDGYGGQEPRMTCNINLTERISAYDMVHNICSIFRGMPIWDGLTLSAALDIPGDVKKTYNKSNVIGGFSYSASALKERHNAIEVTYVDKNNSYKKAVEYVSDDERINMDGLNATQIDAYGATTRGQARRAGLYILESEKLERWQVSFIVGQAGLFHRLYDIIEIADSEFWGQTIGGRIAEISSDMKTIKLDRTIELGTSQDGLFGYINETNLEFVKIPVQSISESGDSIILESTATGASVLGAWSLTVNNLGPRLFRCTSITENINDNNEVTYSILAVEHIPEKTSVIDNGVVFEETQKSLYGSTIGAPKNLSIEDTHGSTLGMYRAFWDSPATAKIIKFQVKISINGNFVLSANVDKSEFYFSDLPVGNYSISVRGMDVNTGELGEPAEGVFTIAVPLTPSSISWSTGNLTATLRAVTSLKSLGERYAWYFGGTEAAVVARTNYLGEAYILNKVDLMPNTTYWFGVVAVNDLGESGIRTVQVLTKFDSSDLEGLINQALPNTDYINQMNENIDGLSNLASLRVVDPNGTRPRITGVYVNAGNAELGQSSIIDFVADAMAISSPDTLERWLYFDTVGRQLIIQGDIRAVAGYLDNVTIRENCTILGTLNASHIEGDVSSSAFIPGKVLTKNNNSITIVYAGGMSYPVKLFIPYLNVTREGTGAASRLYIDFNGSHVIGGTSNVREYIGAIGFDIPAGATNQTITIYGNSIDDSETYPVQAFMIVASPIVSGRFSVS